MLTKGEIDLFLRIDGEKFIHSCVVKEHLANREKMLLGVDFFRAQAVVLDGGRDSLTVESTDREERCDSSLPHKPVYFNSLTCS